MAWCGFFFINPLKTGLGVFGSGLTIGLSISTWLAFTTRDKCSAAALGIIHHMGQYIDIPKVSGKLDISGENLNFTLENLNITIPKALAEIVGGIDKLPETCFDLAFYTGLILSVLASATAANTVITQLVARTQTSHGHLLLNSA